jgi:hypothetical protein
MADLLREEGAAIEARVVSGGGLLHELGEGDREAILDRLNGRTTADIDRDLALREAALVRLAGDERRCGRDRRSGNERRSDGDWTPPGGERRAGADRRSGRDRRRARSAA